MDIILLIILWGVPLSVFSINILRLNQEEKEKLKQKLRSPVFLFSDGFKTLGIMIFCTGIIRTFAILKPIGILFLFVGWLTGGAIMWKSSKKASIGMISISMIVPFLYYLIIN